MSSRGIKVGVASRVPIMWPRRLLRLITAETCDQTLPRHASSRHVCASTSKLDVVLPSRDHGKPWATHSCTEVNRIRLRSGAIYQFVTISMMLACALVAPRDSVSGHMNLLGSPGYLCCSS